MVEHTMDVSAWLRKHVLGGIVAEAAHVTGLGDQCYRGGEPDTGQSLQGSGCLALLRRRRPDPLRLRRHRRPSPPPPRRQPPGQRPACTASPSLKPASTPRRRLPRALPDFVKQDTLARKIAEGNTKREARRGLKRHLSDVVYRRLRAGPNTPSRHS